MKISKTTWQELFSLAIQFKQLAPWNWVHEQDVFGMKNPETGETAYCTILGNGGEFFGIGIYVGTAGLNSLYELASGEITDPLDAALSQRCLMVSYGDQEDLMESDEKIYKMMSMKFKGKNSHPLFHDYTPGYFPWSIETEAQATMIKFALSRAIIVAQECKEDENFLTPLTDNAEQELYKVSVATKKGSDYEWAYEWLEPIESEEDEELPEIQISQVYLKSNLANLPKNATKSWIVEIFQAPYPAQDKEGERPFFPKVLLYIDPETGMVIDNESYPMGKAETDFQKSFVKCCKAQKYIPSKLFAGNEYTYEFIEALGKEIGIETILDEDTGDFVEEIKTLIIGEMMDEDE
jgi:hypothetical protein